MRKLEIILSEEQYQHMQAAIQYENRTHLSEGVFGGYELCLSVGVPDVFGSILELRTNEVIDLGEVKWEVKKMEKKAC
ncbi:MAG: hypothetical protein ACQEWD_12515 [Bacteroidota bacterium]